MKELLKELIENEVRVDLVENDLSVKISKKGIRPELIEKIRNRKAELVKYLQGLRENDYQKIPLAGDKESYAMSSAQYRLWVQCQFDEINRAYNIPTTYVFETGVNRNFIGQAFQMLIERHEILRTVFRKDDEGEVRQFILSPQELNFRISYDNLVGTTDVEVNTEALLTSEMNDLFDLENGPLIRVKLIQINENSVILSYVVHHIISDAWSMRVIMNELFQYYGTLEAGEPIRLSPLELQYKDYAEWEQKIIHGDQFKTQREYWEQQFEGEVPVLNIVDEKPRPPFKTYNGAIISRIYDQKILNGIKEISGDSGTTLFMKLLTALNVLLYKYSGQQDIVIGTSIAGREHPDLEDQVGFYLNALALRTTFKENESYQQILDSVKKTTLNAFENQTYPIEQVVQTLNGPRDMSRSPLFDVMMDMNEGSVGSQGENEEGVQLKAYKDFQVSVGSKFDMTFHFVEQRNGLRVMMEYNTDVFSPAFAENLLTHFEELLRSIIAEPVKPVSALNYVNEEEQNYLLYEVNSTEQQFAQNETLVDLFEKQVEQAPDNLALRYEETVFTYAELNERANQLADYLATKEGIGTGDCVVLNLERSEWLIISILGILKTGACYIPVDPDYPQDRVDYIIENSGSDFMIDEEELQAFNLMRSRYKKTNREVAVSPNDRAYVIYTSGSTGRPKGVMVEHHNAVNYIEWAKQTYLNEEKCHFGLFTSVAFDLTVTSIFTALLSGNSIEIVGSDVALDKIITTYFSTESPLNIAKLTPSHIDALAALNLDKTNVHTVVLGGEELTLNQVRTLRSLNPEIRIFNEYGPTETTVGVIVEEVQKSPERIYIGNPIANTKVYVLDKHLSLIGKGVQGELYIAGEQVARGYINNEALTEERFIQSPFDENVRLYKTGDLVKWSSNEKLVFLGRNDEQVKLNGYRIELGGIESAMQEYPSLNASAVIIKKADDSGKQLIGFYEATEEVEPSDLKEHLAKFLPNYMIPHSLIQLDKIPLTTNGKIDKHALSEYIGENEKAEYVAPQTEMEKQMASIWELVLGREKVGTEDNFFDLGGDSIKILRLVSELRKTFNVDLPIGSIYSLKTIKEMIAFFETESGTLEENNKWRIEQEVLVNREFYTLKASVLSSGNVTNKSNIEDVYPMSAIEIGMVYESMVSKGVYHDQMVHNRFFHNFDLPRFEQAVNLIVQKHQILRTTFNLEDFDREVQFVLKSIELPLKFESLEHLNDEQQDAELAKFLRDELNNSFELSKPMWRLNIFKLRNEFYTIVFQCHHAVIDGWSDAAFNTELSNLYQLLEENPDFVPEMLVSSYRDHVVEQEVDRKNEQVLNFWKEELMDCSRLDMFTNQMIDEGGSVRISADELKHVEAVASQLGTTVKVVSFSAYLLTLDALNFEEEILTGLVTNVRPATEDGDQILGCFLNTIPVRFKPDRNLTFRDFVKTADKKIHQLRAYERLGLREIAEIHGANHTTGNAFFDMYFNFVDFHVYDKMAERQETEIYQEEILLDYDRNESSKVLAKGNTFMDFHVSLTGGVYSANVHLTRTLKSGLSAKRIAEMYERALSSILHNTDATLGTFDGVSDVERQQMLHDFNDTALPYEKSTIQQLVADQIQKMPEETALVFEDQSYSFKTLDEWSNKLANYLAEHKGVAPGDLVGIKLERSEWIVFAIIAVLKNGAAYIPIDPEYPEDRVKYIESHSGFGVCIDDAFIREFKEKAHDCSAQHDLVKGAPEDLIYTIYTSGSTGQPKGVALKQQSVANLMAALRERLPVSTEDVLLSQTTISFDIFVTEIFYPLLTGMTLVLGNEEVQRSPKEMEREVLKRQVTTLQLTPSRLALILQENTSGLWKGIKNLFLVGEALSEALINELRKVYKGRVINAYGPTETCVYSTMRALQSNEEVAIGTPLANTQVYILDEGLRMRPPGVPGEICIAGDGLALGYLHNEELTATKFVENPFNNGERLYRTGDVGKWLPDGNLQFIGRKDDQIKLRGYRIEPGEIEKVLISDDTIDDVVVIVREVEGVDELVAYLVASEQVAPSELRAFLSKQLPAYMIPAFFIYLENMPLTGNGKIDKKALPGFDTMDSGVAVEILAPESLLEEHILRQWRVALNGTEIGVGNDFFLSGGNSIKAIKASIHANGRYPVNLIYQYRTVRDYAKAIEQLETNTLVRLHNTREENRQNIILFPYAGASDAMYANLADALSGNFNVYIVSYPWHFLHEDFAYLEGVELRNLIETEIRMKVKGETILLGTSAGSSMAVAIAGNSGKNSIIRGLVLCASAYVPELYTAENPWLSYTDAQIEVGLNISGEIENSTRKQIVANLRQDGRISWDLMLAIGATKLDYPVQVILGGKDSSTRNEDLSGGWKQLFEEVQADLISDGGHYFVQENVAEVVEIIKTTTQKWKKHRELLINE